MWRVPQSASVRRLAGECAVSASAAVAVVAVWCAFVEGAWHRARGDARTPLGIHWGEATRPVDLRVYEYADLAEEVHRWDRAVLGDQVDFVIYARGRGGGSGYWPANEAVHAADRMKALLYHTGLWKSSDQGEGVMWDWNGRLIVLQTPVAHARIDRLLGAIRASIRASAEREAR